MHTQKSHQTGLSDQVYVAHSTLIKPISLKPTSILSPISGLVFQMAPFRFLRRNSAYTYYFLHITALNKQCMITVREQ